MPSIMLKINPDKTVFIILGFYAQIKKLDPYLPVRIFGNFMHQAVVVKKPSGLMLISPLLIIAAIFITHASFKFVISGGLHST